MQSLSMHSLDSLFPPLADPLPLSFVWRDASLHAAPNTWTYFRKVFNWVPGDERQQALACFAADPTARVWLNGRLLLDRVLRFVSPNISVEILNLAPFLVPGENVLVVLHHWWGVPTFQRSPGGRPGIAFCWNPKPGGVLSDSRWFWRPADEFVSHPHQTIGHDGAPRIRFPVLFDSRLERPAIHTAVGDNHADWQPAVDVQSDAWANPACKETPPLTRCEYVSAVRVLSVGRLSRSVVTENLPLHQIGGRMRQSLHLADERASRRELLPGDASVLLHSPAYISYDFGRPVHGYTTIEIGEAPPGAVLELGYAELAINPRDQRSLVASDGHFDPEFTCGSPFGDRVVLRGGPQIVMLPEERTWRYLLIHCPGEGRVWINGTSCRASQHPAPPIGDFHASDQTGTEPEFLSSLIQLSQDHAKVTMSDTYVDTPGREDAQWLEDIQYRARLAASWYGDTTLRQVTLRHAVEQQDPQTGLFRVFAPEDYGDNGCQFLDWGMTWIGLLHDDWQWTGRTGLLQRYYPALKRFLAALERYTTSDGLLTGRGCLADNLGSSRLDHDKEPRGYESIPNSWYYGHLIHAAEIANAIGESSDAAAHRARAARIRHAFQRFLTCIEPPLEAARDTPWGGEPPFLSDAAGALVAELWTPDNGPHEWGQAAVVNAVYHGLIADATLARTLLQTAFPDPDGVPPADSRLKRWNTPTTIYRTLCALSEHGLGELAVAHLAATYGPYLPDGPLPEYFVPGPAHQPADPSGSHGWAAVPLAWLHDTVLGVKPRHATATTPAHVLVSPRYVGWDRVTGTVATPFGPVEVALDWASRSLRTSGPADIAIIGKLPETPTSILSLQ